MSAGSINRRKWMLGAAALPLTASGVRAAEGDPPFTLSCNIELMFPREMSHADRLRAIADNGYRAFSFWGAAGKDLASMQKVQRATGMQCGSITGNGKTGWSTGLTQTGEEKAFLDDIRTHIETAKKFDAVNLICFAGKRQENIPWETQYRQIIDGLRRAGDLAAKHGVYVVLEPLNRVESPQMTVLTAQEGFQIVEEVNHPHVRLDFDMYHLQLSEGNLINNLRQGLDKGWIRFVEVGDVPGRMEPGTGEVNYPNIFKVLHEKKYSGFVGLEHRSSSTPQHAMDVVRKMARG